MTAVTWKEILGTLRLSFSSYNLRIAVPSCAKERSSHKNLTEGDVKDLSCEDASMCRAIVERGKYLSTHRRDIRYGVKELARQMSQPRHIDDRQLIHFRRYLHGKMRVMNKYAYQRNCKIIDVWCDTDNPGCLETSKSTTGGVVIFGAHVIEHWSFWLKQNP